MSSAPGGSEASNATSPTLVSGVRQRHPDAWKRFSVLYGPLVYHWVRQAGLQESDASDLVQDVFLAVFGSIATFDGRPAKGSFRRWLWGITRNKVQDHMQRLMNQPRAAGGTDAMTRMHNQPAPLAEGEPSDASELDAGFVQRAMGLLQSDFEETTWRAFWRVVVDGQRAASVARELGISTKAVRQAKYRVLRRLRAELEE